MASPVVSAVPVKTAYFPALTGIRAIAAYLVFCGHVDVGKFMLPPLGYLAIKMAGHLSLAVFFVLSSFVISFRYADKLSFKKEQFQPFYLKRFARIYPAYLLVTIFILCWQQDFNGWHWFLNLTFLKGFFTKEKFTGIAQAWSLSVEECFYSLAPLVFFGFRKYAWQTIIGLYLIGVVLVFGANLAGSASFMPNTNFMLEYTFFGRCFEFYCGYWLAKFYKNNGTSNFKYATLFGCLLLLLCLLAVVFTLGKQVFLFGGFAGIAATVLLNNFILPPVIVLFFYGLLTENTFVSRVLSSRVFQVLGRHSYAFALLHAGLFYEFMYFHLSQSKIIIFLLLNVLAAGIYRLVEAPIYQAVKRKVRL